MFFACGNLFFFLRFPTNIGWKLTDEIRLLNLMLVRKQIGAWRVVFGFSCCPSRGCASQEWRKRLGHPELLRSLSVTGPLEPRFNGVVTGWDESQGYGRAAQIFFFYGAVNSSLILCICHLFYTCQPLLYFVVISYILSYLVVQIQQGWWRITSQLHACLFVRRGQEDPASPVDYCWGLWVFGLAKRWPTCLFARSCEARWCAGAMGLWNCPNRLRRLLEKWHCQKFLSEIPQFRRLISSWQPCGNLHELTHDSGWRLGHHRASDSPSSVGMTPVLWVGH